MLGFLFSLMVLTRLFLKLLDDLCLQRLGLRSACPPAHDFPVLANQEFLKVPLDALESQQAGFLALHPLPHRFRIAAVDVGLAQHGKTDTVVELAKLLDLVVRAGILASKLVAGKSQDHELVGVFRRDLFPQLFKALELWREAALGGRVDRQDDLPFVLGEGVFLRLFVFGREVEEASC